MDTIADDILGALKPNPLDIQWTAEEHQQMLRKGAKRAYEKFYQERVTERINAMKVAKDPTFQAAIDQKEVRRQQLKSTHVWITITPHHLADIMQVHKRVLKALKKKGMTQWKVTFEQTGEDELTMGVHPHVHMLINRYDEPAEIIKYYNDRFLPFCGSTKNIHIQWDTEKDVPTRINYLNGIKKDADKLPKVQTDVEWRNSLGLNIESKGF